MRQRLGRSPPKRRGAVLEGDPPLSTQPHSTFGQQFALFTGAARGQSRAHAIRLAEEGADIIAVDICAPVSTRRTRWGGESSDLEETVKPVEQLDCLILSRQGDTRDLEGFQSQEELDINLTGAWNGPS